MDLISRLILARDGRDRHAARHFFWRIIAGQLVSPTFRPRTLVPRNPAKRSFGEHT
jgi:hypothetical protein